MSLSLPFVPRPTHLYRTDTSSIQRLLQKIDGIDVENPVFVAFKCNIWTGAISSNKHTAVLAGNNGTIHAHRLMYALTYGLPEDLVDHNDLCPCGYGRTYGKCCRAEVTHICKDINGEHHKGLCVNPLHLRLATHDMNQQDMVRHKTAKGKIQKGETHGNNKYSAEFVTRLWQTFQDQVKIYTAQHGNSRGVMKQVAQMFAAETASILDETEDIGKARCYSLLKDLHKGVSWCEITGLNNQNQKYQQRHQREQQRLAASLEEKQDRLTSMNIPNFYSSAAPCLSQENTDTKTCFTCQRILPLCFFYQPSSDKCKKCFDLHQTQQTDRTKSCTKCGIHMPLQFFKILKRTGLPAAQCKPCTNKKQQEQRAKKNVAPQQETALPLITKQCSKCEQIVPINQICANGSWCYNCRLKRERDITEAKATGTYESRDVKRSKLLHSISTSGQKFCSRCQETKPIQSFGSCSKTPDKFQRWCKPCKSEQAKQTALLKKTNAS